jgi:hypothetical protein
MWSQASHLAEARPELARVPQGSPVQFRARIRLRAQPRRRARPCRRNTARPSFRGIYRVCFRSRVQDRRAPQPSRWRFARRTRDRTTDARPRQSIRTRLLTHRVGAPKPELGSFDPIVEHGPAKTSGLSVFHRVAPGLMGASGARRSKVRPTLQAEHRSSTTGPARLAQSADLARTSGFRSMRPRRDYRTATPRISHLVASL